MSNNQTSNEKSVNQASSDDKSQNQTVAQVIVSSVGNIVGTSGTFFASSGTLIFVHLLSGYSISLAQYFFFQLSKGNNKDLVFTPLMNMPLEDSFRMTGLSLALIAGGSVLRVVGNKLASNGFINFVNEKLYGKKKQ